MKKKSDKTEIVSCQECLYKTKCSRKSELTYKGCEPLQFRIAGCENGRKPETIYKAPNQQ